MNYVIAIILAVISTILAATGQLFLKFGSVNLKKDLKSVLKNYFLILGVFSYGLSSIIFVIALKWGELTVLYSLAALNYVWVSLLAIKFLKEKMNIWKWFGILLIITGVILIV